MSYNNQPWKRTTPASAGRLPSPSFAQPLRHPRISPSSQWLGWLGWLGLAGLAGWLAGWLAGCDLVRIPGRIHWGQKGSVESNQ